MLNSVNPEGEKQLDGLNSDLWIFFNGGQTTYAQYEKLKKAERQALLKWINDCLVIKTLDIGGKSFCLTHSYYRKGLEDMKYKDLPYKDVWNIVWKSIFREDWETHGENIYGRYDYTFITGHVPVQRIRQAQGDSDGYNFLRSYTEGNLIDIDGGCSYEHMEGLNNGLLFLSLDDMRTFAVPLQ